jgi:hypothetical protein
MLRFFERFGNPDAPVFVLSGGTADDRRAVVDRITAALEQEDGLRGRVLAHRPAGGRRGGAAAAARGAGRGREGAAAGAADRAGDRGRTAGVVRGDRQQIQAGLDGEAPADARGRRPRGCAGWPTWPKTFDRTSRARTCWPKLGEPRRRRRRGRDARGYLIDGRRSAPRDQHVPAASGDAVTDVAAAGDQRLRRSKRRRAGERAGRGDAQITGLPALIVDEQH